MKNFTDILMLLLVLVLPIGVGYLLRLTRIFNDKETDVLRKFVIRVCVPFLVFKNLYKTETSVLDQLLPSIFAFVLLCILYTGAAYLLSQVVSHVKPHRDTYAFAVSMGNYMFLGWGVVHSFYGEAAFTRAVFFTIFFWPVFLLGGFWLAHRQGSKDGKRSFLSLIISNGGVALAAALLGIVMNRFHIPIPGIISDLVDKFAVFTIPMILMVIGLNFALIMPKANFKIIAAATFTRLIGGFALGFATLVITRFLFSPDLLTGRVILMESIMPTAALTVFFVDHSEMDKELLAGIITFSTLISLATIPLWYVVIEKFFPAL
ncbi:MAG: AEC family transporter [Candidatus Aminicenantes bacterium]|nr:AEC family transporter [Candidatus Aminicenantes bacterium]